jgi:hypothetical protein
MVLAANVSRSKGAIALDQGMFRKKHKKAPHFTLGGVFPVLHE